MRPARVLRSLALAALLTGCGAGGGEPVFLGVAGPLSQANGRSMRLAAEMAVEEINARGGIHGRPLALIFKDDEANPERAIEVAAELRDDPRVLAVVGHVNSAASLAAADIYNDPENGLVELSPASSSPALSEAGEWTFRVCPSDLQHGPALARWIHDQLKRRRAAVLYANDDYGRGVLDSFADAFRAAGGEVIARDPYLPSLYEDERTLDPYLERALRQRMDALVVAGQAEEALRIVRAARRLGYRGPILGADGLTGLRDAGEIAEGVFVTSAFLPDRPTPAARRFVQDYQDRFGELPDHRGAMTYDAIHLLARVIEELGPGATRREIRDYLAGVGTRTPAFEGVSGTIAFDENGDVASKDVAVGIIREGEIRTAS